jgi:hypothetical protein
MTDLKAEDIEIQRSPSGWMEGDVEKRTWFDKLIIDCHLESGAKLKKQILEWKEFYESHKKLIHEIEYRNELVVKPRLFHELREKADKWDKLSKDCQTDDLYSHISNVCDGAAMDRMNLQKLEQEVKTLQEENMQLQLNFDACCRSNQQMSGVAGVLRDENQKNKEIVSKVRELSNKHRISIGSEHCDMGLELKEILGEKDEDSTGNTG